MIIAASFIILIKSLKVSPKMMNVIEGHGIQWGIIIMTIAVLMPIANDKINIKEFLISLKSPLMWVALISGILVSILGREGLKLLTTSPEITVALVIGTIISVSLFRGVAVGPLIGAGIAYLVMSVVRTFM